MNRWLILTATLPTRPSGLRVKVWRALKATHCATLREGVYILPAQPEAAARFGALEADIRAAGAQAYLLELAARDAAQQARFVSLFDRTAAYAEFHQALRAAAAALAGESEAAGQQRLRRLSLQWQGLLASDFFPGPAAAQAQAALEALQAQARRRWSPGEPVARQAALERLDRAEHQGRCWATRARPGVDRLACAWLITRFIDASPRFVWLTHTRRLPRGALGFDFDGARFTHVGERVSFEVLLESFGLAEQPGLPSLATLVHLLDVGSLPPGGPPGPAPADLPQDAAPGLDLLLRGLQAQHADDDALLAAALPLFDTLLAGLARAPETPA